MSRLKMWEKWPPNPTVPCRWCTRDFVPAKKREYCSHECRQADRQQRALAVNEHRGWEVPTGTVGAIHELMVAADLLKRGYHVFRAMSPACPCDLVVLEKGTLRRVEVTTGCLSGNGTLHHSKKDSGAYDVLAVVNGSAITYRPELPLLSRTQAVGILAPITP